MIYMKRKIDDFLTNWKKDKDRMPLIIKGARQIGKTESILHFANNNYESIIYINFAKDEIYKSIINNGYDPTNIIKAISLINSNARFIENKTIIIFDELQEFPEIATSLKFFKIDGRFDVICSGSLLGISYKRIESNSVGYKQDYLMYSMDFEEFLWAKNYTKKQIEDLYSHMLNGIPFSELEMNVYSNLFMDYCVLGGMPNVVKDYLEKNTFENTLKIQEQIINDYKEDIKKYAEGIEKTKILSVFNHIPSQLAKENKKFQISKIRSGAKAKDYFGCIEWLEEAGIINICYCMNDLQLPIKGNQNDAIYKLYFADTGLLISLLDEEAQFDLRANKNLGVYKGGIYENIISEALVKQKNYITYYKKSNSTLEIDFVTRTQDNIVPIEVKSLNNQSKSLKSVINSNNYDDIKFGIKFIKGNIGFSNNIYTFPHFCAFLLKRFLKEKFN